MGKQLTQAQLITIKQLRECNSPESYQKIANKLHKHKSTIIKAYHRIKCQKVPHRKGGTGGNIKTTPREDRHIKLLAISDPYLSHQDIKQKLNLQISTDTIRRRLKENLETIHILHYQNHIYHLQICENV